MTKKLTNGFATKKDINRLERKIDKRFEQVNDQFKFFRSELKDDWDFFKSDTFREFEHRWQQKIDPILAEIGKHREEEIIMSGQYRRLEALMVKIADKVGIPVTD
ncbi:hypothetical protein AUK18_00285 [Candidatus Beckwithbacteria bacterium CG2_30_44_31]|uniref:Uncharacterized protein n=1 Tax=Candidatus Beckwithbacteria bacterium CG2_30_44_31 TaxID=1805035 RepID=A0A1J5B8N5_9BACT|nr:MAG: hypothetical protein AUK18_00285 [Candidatus Beckwithbacteria bacterium CG2_30_44_31]